MDALKKLICRIITHSQWILNFIYVFIVFYNLSGCSATSYTRPLTKVISTKYGVVRGLLTQFTSELRPQLQPVESYLGIPYAAAPVGNLRFMPPTTPSQFEGGVRNATKFGPVCPQISPNISALEKEGSLTRGRIDYLKRLDVYLRNQSEDCLYLNIYVPSSSREEKEPMPVLIYIDGESYSWGSGNPYDGTVLASYGNMIVVTLNYRLGLLGFLTTDDGFARGNYGLMDQVAAIRFVEENIEQFGGDASNISLMGHGTGAACVNLLMISPVATNGKKLFQRAILLSGSALVPGAVSHDPKKYAVELARAVKCPVEGSSMDMVRCLKTKSVEELNNVQLEVPQFLTGFGPAVDGVFIPNQPRIIMRNYASLYRKYGLMIGLTRNEAVNMFSRKDLLNGFDENRQNRLLRTFVRNLFSHHLSEVFMAVKFEYAEWEKFPHSASGLRDATMDIFGDALTVAPTMESAQLHAGSVAQDTYMFLFHHFHRHNEEEYPAQMESAHGDEMPYVFGAPLMHHGRLSPWPGNWTSQDAFVSEVMTNYIANYVRTGDPRKMPRKQSASLTDAVRQSVTNSPWPKFDSDRQKYLQISSRSREVRDHFRAHKNAFWTELIPKLNTAVDTAETRSHHTLSDFDKLETYEGLVRSMAFLTLPPPPLPPSTTPPPWRNKTKTQSMTQSTGSTEGNEVFVTPVDPEPLGYNATSHTALSITVAIGCTLLVINILVCVGVYYQKNKMRKKYLTNRSAPEKRNGVTPGGTEHEKAEETDHAESLLPPSASSHNYSVPGTPLPVMHYHHNNHNADRAPVRTFNTFSDQHFQTAVDTDPNIPPSIHIPSIIRAMPHLGVQGSLAEQTLQRKHHAELLRKAATMNNQKNEGSTEQDETAV